MGDYQFARNDRLLVGPETLDDAGVYQLTDDIALVQTVDFFPPVTDDARLFGRIAAANALSDIYAMGATPVTALNMVGFPSDDLDLSLLRETLQGGDEVVCEAGAVIAGGHSVKDTEFKYGLAVTGTVHPDRVIRNQGGRPGDLVLLTKPIGTGVVTTAYRRGKISDADARPVFEQMATLNRDAASILSDFGAHAATDVTGFGLLGHGYELTTSGDVTLRLFASTIPILPVSYGLARSGLFTGNCQQTQEDLNDGIDVSAKVNRQVAQLCFDAETSGGLLACIPPDRADEALRSLHDAGVAEATIVGQMEARGDVAVQLDP